MNKKMEIKKETAVEWLVKYLSERGYIQAPSFGHSIIDKAIEQAKQMERLQSVDDFTCGNFEGYKSANGFPSMLVNDYINKKYKQ